MKMVLLVWLLQWGAVLYVAFRNADYAAFLQRLRAALSKPSVWMLAAGCVAFLFAGGTTAAQHDFPGVILAIISFLFEVLLLIGALLRGLFTRRGVPDLVFGSAEFATPEHAAANGLIGETGIRLGRLRHPEAAQRGMPVVPLHYTGERHLLTVAPTRAGKGVSTIIPNLLTYPGSMIVIDPKGENAKITAQQRMKFGRVAVVDPWGISGYPAATFNPLQLLTPDSPTLVEDATLIAEALVVHESGGNAAHFSEQASDLVKGLLLYMATTESETATLGRLRGILTSSPENMMKSAIAMSKANHHVVRAAAAQIAGKNDKEWLSIVSTAQRNTHFLDSGALRLNLATSAFSFAELKGDKPFTVYLVLPVDRLSSHARWLRMIVALAIAQLARTQVKPKRPVLFMLDEFAQLGRMPIIEDAYGLMAGMGLQMHAIVQDLSQLQRVYGEGWQTFVGNAGAIQVFGTRDLMTAEYFSKLVGVTTRIVRSTSSSHGSSSGSGSQPGSSNSGTSVSHAPTQRPLLFPDELMRMDAGAQIVFVENANPCLSDKLVWHTDPALKVLGRA